MTMMTGLIFKALSKLLSSVTIATMAKQKKLSVTKQTVSTKNSKKQAVKKPRGGIEPIQLLNGRPFKQRISDIRQHFNIKPTKKTAYIAIGLGFILLAYFGKSLFISALVNNQPITAIELNNRMSALYKDRVLDQLIDQKIIEQEASKKGVVVSSQQINDKMAETESTYGGKEVFDSLLQQQGLGRDEFIRLTRLQLLMEGLYKNEATPSEEEIVSFINANANTPEATDPARLRQIAQDQIQQQKMVQIFGQKLEDLRNQSKIQTF